VFSFQDDDEQWLSLRYDLTAPLARHVAENFQNIALPFRSYREGYVFRNEKPGPGRFRQFLQFDADTVGSASMAADAEMCMLAADTMEALGIKRGDYLVKVNSRKLLDGVLESLSLGGEANLAKRLTVLRAIDKLDRLGADAVTSLLGEGRKDESGDFTKGAGLSKEQIDKVFYVAGGKHISWRSFGDRKELPTNDEWVISLDKLNRDFGIIVDSASGEVFFSNDQVIDSLEEPLSKTDIGKTGIEELRGINTILQDAGYGSNRVRIASDVVRGLEYYTGPVYEIELLLETKDEKNRPVRIG
jgi:histidyl-tRNA synthetase